MLERFRRRLHHANPQLLLFLAAIVFLGVANGIYETTFNNFLQDTFDLSAQARGHLEFPRELPGFLVAVLAGALFFLPETRVAAVATLTACCGMIGLATVGYKWPLMIASIVLWSAGVHVMMPLRQALGLSLAHPDRQGARLGQVAGFGTAAIVIGASFVWLGTEYFSASYRVLFWIAAGLVMLASVVFLRMHTTTGLSQRRPKFVFRQRYRLFYILSILFGARKQVFITFGPWVLVKVFQQSASTIAKLWITSSMLGVFINPRLGRAVDRFGERVILMADAVLLVGICLGYGFAESVLPGPWALRVLYMCFVLDQLLFAVGMARTTYLRKIAANEDDVTATLSLSVSIDHAVSMSLPSLGGLIWAKYGYPWVFVGAACVGLMTLWTTSRIPKDL